MIDKNKYLKNNEINCESLLLIDENGNNVGVVTRSKAVYLSKTAELDLVCINNKTSPIVCKIMDYNKFLYEQNIKNKELKKKSKTTETKEIQLRVQIADHDMMIKSRKAREELLKGNKIRVLVIFKGRQLAHPYLGYDLMNKFVKSLEDVSEIFKKSELDHNKIEYILTKKK